MTPRGMKQSFNLGEQLRRRYINGTFNFLPPFYDSRRIYITSTSINRTVNSAASKMYGMYGKAEYGARPSIDYPEFDGWQPGFVPIPIFTDPEKLYSCNRAFEMMTLCGEEGTMPEVVEYRNTTEFKEQARILSSWFGSNGTLSDDKLGIAYDTLTCQRNNFNGTLHERVNGYSEEAYQKVTAVLTRFMGYRSCVYKTPTTYKGHDVTTDMQKIMGGLILSEMKDRIQWKSDCAKNSTGCSPFIQNIQYYGYSTHDNNIFSILTIFGLQDLAAQHWNEFPTYSACLLVELFVDSTNNPYFRLVYRINSTATFEPISQHIELCKGEQFCPVQVLEKLEQKYRMTEDIGKWCSFTFSSSSSLAYFFVLLTSMLLNL